MWVSFSCFLQMQHQAAVCWFKHLQTSWILSGSTLHNGYLILQGIMPVSLLQVLQPFPTSTGARHSVLIHWSLQLQWPHMKTDKKTAPTENNDSTGHLLSTLLLVQVESLHKRSIQWLETSPETAPVPCSTCPLSTWAGRGFLLNTCSHCGLWEKIRWGEHHAYQLQWGDCVASHCASTVYFWWKTISDHMIWHMCIPQHGMQCKSTASLLIQSIILPGK